MIMMMIITIMIITIMGSSSSPSTINIILISPTWSWGKSGGEVDQEKLALVTTAEPLLVGYCYIRSDDVILSRCVKVSSQKMQKKMRLYACGDHLSERWVRFGAA